MFSKLFKKEKPRVFLGALLVAPVCNWMAYSDGWGLFKSENLEDGLRKSLELLVDMPSVSEITDPKPNDLALELAVLKIHGGTSGDLKGLFLGLPIGFRPRVQVRARLYNIESGETVVSVLSERKMKWTAFANNMFSLNAVLRYKPLFNVKDMEGLLYLAAVEALQKVQKKL